ncbi:MAG: phytoene desaturase family protein, partial [Gemmataceae bacterium]
MVARSKKRIGIIGGGLGGLASACTLAARGHEVTLFDKNDWVGGKAAVLEGKGFRFDMGPTILTLPSVLRRIFAEAGHKLEDRLNLVRLDPQWRCFYQDGSHLDLMENVQTMVERIRGMDPKSAEGYRKFQELSQRLNRISQKFFFWKSIGSLWDMFSFK